VWRAPRHGNGLRSLSPRVAQVGYLRTAVVTLWQWVSVVAEPRGSCTLLVPRSCWEVEDRCELWR